MKQNAETTDEFIRQNVASGKKYCLLLLKAGPKLNQPPAEAERIRMEHLRHTFQMRAEGKLLINGPVLDDPELRAIGIFNTTDKEEVKKFMERDPAVRAGWFKYEIYLWFGIPGDSLPK